LLYRVNVYTHSKIISRFSKQFIRASCLSRPFFSVALFSLFVRRFLFSEFHTIFSSPHQNLAVTMAAVSNICANFEEVGQVRAFNAPFFFVLLSFCSATRAFIFKTRNFDSRAILQRSLTPSSPAFCDAHTHERTGFRAALLPAVRQRSIAARFAVQRNSLHAEL